jgi:hypothetical protein
MLLDDRAYKREKYNTRKSRKRDDDFDLEPVIIFNEIIRVFVRFIKFRKHLLTNQRDA